MFNKLFSPDSGLMITMSNITDCIFLSLFWILGCFPVVTLGASLAALYDAAFRGLRRGDRHSWQRFLKTFRRNLLPGILPGLLVLVLFAALVLILVRLWNGAVGGSLSWMAFSAGALMGCLALGIISVMLPMLSRFDNTFGVLVKNTALLALANLPRTLVLGILNALTVVLTIRFVFPLFFAPALAAFLGSFLIEPMFRPYLPEEDAPPAA